MKYWQILLLPACLMMAACSNSPNNAAGGGSTPEVATNTGASDNSGGQPLAEAAPVQSAPQPASVPIESGAAVLGPDNTMIQFVGTHVGDKPDPRTGGFEQFTGKAEVDAQSKMLKSVSVEIQTDSLSTPIPKLTNHLKSPDFFDTREHPTAKFASTNVTAGSNAGEVSITGDLTLLGTTKEISFPATVNISDKGLALNAKFTIDRTEFGMAGFQDQVEKQVSLSVAIGEKTQPQSGGDEPSETP